MISNHSVFQFSCLFACSPFTPKQALRQAPGAHTHTHQAPPHSNSPFVLVCVCAWSELCLVVPIRILPRSRAPGPPQPESRPQPASARPSSPSSRASAQPLCSPALVRLPVPPATCSGPAPTPGPLPSPPRTPSAVLGPASPVAVSPASLRLPPPPPPSQTAHAAQSLAVSGRWRNLRTTPGDRSLASSSSRGLGGASSPPPRAGQAGARPMLRDGWSEGAGLGGVAAGEGRSGVALGAGGLSWGELWGGPEGRGAPPLPPPPPPPDPA